MPRRIPQQVPQSISRMLQAGYYKTPPTSHIPLLFHPPMPLPSLSPVPRSEDDLPPTLVRRMQQAKLAGARERDRANSNKRIRTRVPSMKPKPIVYLHDKVRKQFYIDHPWEGLRPRSLAEKDKLDDDMRKEPPEHVTDLTWWSTNPQPEDAIALTVHLHKHHNLSLAKAYHQVLSQYHALRAEQEVASRYAVLEAQSYGARFGPQAPEFQERYGATPTFAAPETMRAYTRQERAMQTWKDKADSLSTLDGSSSSESSSAASTSIKKPRMKPFVLPQWTGGQQYLASGQSLLQGQSHAMATHREAQQQARVDAAAAKKSHDELMKQVPEGSDPLELEKDLMSSAIGFGAGERR